MQKKVNECMRKDRVGTLVHDFLSRECDVFVFVSLHTRVVVDHIFKALEREARGDVVPAVV